MVVREERYLSAPKEASGRIAYCKTLSVRSISESSLLICLATIFTLLGLAMHLTVEPILGCKESRPVGLAEWIQAVGFWVLRNGGWGWDKSGGGGIGGWWWWQEWKTRCGIAVLNPTFSSFYLLPLLLLGFIFFFINKFFFFFFKWVSALWDFDLELDFLSDWGGFLERPWQRRNMDYLLYCINGPIQFLKILYINFFLFFYYICTLVFQTWLVT